MKAVLYSDLVASKTQLIQQTFIGLFVAGALSFGMNSLYGVIPAIACAFCIPIAFSLGWFDETNNWQRYRLCLPLNRKQVTLGRYLSAFVMSLFSFLFGIVVFLLIVSIVAFFGNDLPLSADVVSQVQTISWDTVLLIVAVTVFVSLAFNGVLLPLALRFGMTQVLRIVPLVFMVIVIAGVIGIDFLSQSDSGAFILQFFDWILLPGNTLVFSCVTILAACAIYAISFAISAKLYTQREF